MKTILILTFIYANGDQIPQEPIDIPAGLVCEQFAAIVTNISVDQNQAGVIRIDAECRQTQ